MILLGLHLGSGLLVATAVMSGRTVPHAHPATAEYEFANPSRLGEQRFGEGMAQMLPTPTSGNSGLTAQLHWPPLYLGLK